MEGKYTTNLTNKKEHKKLIIYQMFPRIFSNMNPTCIPNGTYEQNGAGKMNHITGSVIKSLADLGVNALWFTGIIEMATKTSFPGIPADNENVVKGEAGSPYAIKDYYDISPAIAEDVEHRMQEFEELINRVHDQGLKVIIDFVPNHTARRYHSDVSPQGIQDFGKNDDFNKFFDASNNYYYIPNQLFAPNFDISKAGTEPYIEFPSKATGNDCYSAFCGINDWYETVKLNYGYDPGDGSRHYDPVPDTWLKMLHILRFWASKGVDGFRCDMVFMVPQEFWHWVIPQVKQDYRDLIFIGEIYDINLYRPFLDYCYFDYLYDKVNLYDTLVGIERHNYSAAQLTNCWQRVDGIGERMLNFLENHDEVRFGSKEYASEPSRVVPSLVVSAFISKGPFMIYYGQELGERALDNEGFAGDNNRSTIFDYWSYDTLRRWYNNGKCTISKLTAQEKWLRKVYKKVLTLANSQSSISNGNFFDLMYVNLQNPKFNPHRQYAFLRYDEHQVLLIVANFDNHNVNIEINIPDLAFDMANIAEGEFECKDILWDMAHKLMVKRGNALSVSLKANDAIVLPLKKRK